MFCEKCGTPNMDGVKFCKNCGAQFEENETVQPYSMPAPAPKPKKRKVGIIVGVAVVVVAAILLGFFLLGGRSYEETIQKYVDAQFQADAETIISLMPEKMLTYALKEDGRNPDDLPYLVDDLGEELKEKMDYFDQALGEGWKVSYKILDAKDVMDSKLASIREAYRAADVKVSEAKTVEVELTITAYGMESSDTMQISLVKVGRSWYLDVMTMGNLF